MATTFWLTVCYHGTGRITRFSCSSALARALLIISLGSYVDVLEMGATEDSPEADTTREEASQ